MDIKPYLEHQRLLVEKHLAACMPEAEGPFANHIESMRYSLFVGGKRIRPILCLAAARSITDDPIIENQVMPIACALECIHTYSLIHDDLPAMDNDDLRRGKPTNHTVFGEAGAILAGDGLLTYAFYLLSQTATQRPTAETGLQVIQIIAQAAGSFGMVGGQALDIANEGKNIPYALLKTIHRSKTGALITAAVEAGATAAGADTQQRNALVSYGNNIGLAFQIVDDLLNVESTTEQLGKAAGSDVERGKATYPALFGIERSHTMAREAADEAIKALNNFSAAAEPLRAIASYIVERKR